MQARDISIVIPAKNEARFLARCLASLNASVAEWGGSARVIVVDNGSTDSTREIAARAGCLVLEDASAKTAATLRNRGAEAAKSEYLAFVDADCLVAPRWIRCCLEVIEGGGASLVGTLASPPVEGRTWVQEACDRLFIQTRRNRPVLWTNTSNMVLKRHVFETAGRFDPALLSAEDVEFSNRLRSLGYAIALETRIMTIHLRESATLPELFAREFKRGHSCLRSLWRTRDKSQELPSVAAPAVFLAALALLCLSPLAGWRSAATGMVVFLLLPLTLLASKHPEVDNAGQLAGCYAVSCVYFAARATALFQELVLLASSLFRRRALPMR